MNVIHISPDAVAACYAAFNITMLQLMSAGMLLVAASWGLQMFLGTAFGFQDGRACAQARVFPYPPSGDACTTPLWLFQWTRDRVFWLTWKAMQKAAPAN